MSTETGPAPGDAAPAPGPAPRPIGPAAQAGMSLNDRLITAALAVALMTALFAGLTYVKAHLRWEPTPPPAPAPHVPTPTPPTPAPAPTPTPAPTPAPLPDWFGLSYPADGSHKALIASMPRLAQAAPHLMRARDAADGRPILLYRAWTDLFRAYPPYPAQQIGDCVSFGHGHANDLLQCIEFCLANPGKRAGPGDIQETDTEALYGMAREAGNMLGRQDGCYGAAAVKAMTSMGLVSRRMLGTDGSYSGRRAKSWGLHGAPDAVKAKAAAYKLGSVAQVGDWDELVAALHAGHPVTICTGLGFSPTRDDQGFVRRKGHWGHCMFVAGVRFDRPGACIIQSWGPEAPSGPTALGQPSFSFWVERADIEAILAEGDSWALSRSPRFGAASARHRRVMPRHWRSARPAGPDSDTAAPAPRRAA